MNQFKKIMGGILLTSALFIPTSALAYTKKETVYIHLDTNGNPYQTVVSNHLYVDDEKTIEDETELRDILNINGDEKFKLENQKLKWQSTGKDIFYKGKTDKELPISVESKYYLDGKEKNPKDMLSKKGHVKIEFTFTNHSYTYKNKEKLYTPIVVTLGTILEDTQNSKITISSGKVVDTGNKSIVVGLAAPGLYESTQLEEVKDLDKIVLEYDTTKFSLSNIYMVASPKLLEEADLAVFNKVDTLSSSFQKMDDSMKQIGAGAKALEEGTKALSNGSSEIASNLQKALEALQKLKEGTSQIDSSLKQVIGTLESTKASLQDKNIVGSLSQLQTLKVQNQRAIESLAGTSESLKNTYTAYNLKGFATIEEVQAYFTEQGVDASIIQNLVICKKTYEGNQNLITLLSTNNSSIDQMLGTLTELNTQIDTLLTGVTNALTEIDKGTISVSSGLTELQGGLQKLHEGASTLSMGVGTLGTGITTLSTGIQTFQKEGIETLGTYVHKGTNYIEKMEDLTRLSKEYKGYTSQNAENTIFIYKMKAVK